MKYLIVFIATFGTGFYVGTQSIEDRLKTLNRKIDACCETTMKDFETELGLPAYIDLKRRVQELEREVNEINLELEAMRP